MYKMWVIKSIFKDISLMQTVILKQLNGNIVSVANLMATERQLSMIKNRIRSKSYGRNKAKSSDLLRNK